MPMTQHITGSRDLLLAYTHPSRDGTAGQVGQAEVDTIEQALESPCLPCLISSLSQRGISHAQLFFSGHNPPNPHPVLTNLLQSCRHR